MILEDAVHQVQPYAAPTNSILGTPPFFMSACSSAKSDSHTVQTSGAALFQLAYSLECVHALRCYTSVVDRVGTTTVGVQPLIH